MLLFISPFSSLLIKYHHYHFFLSTCAVQLAHKLLTYSAPFSMSLLHRPHASILTFQLSDLSHYISVLPAKS